MKLLTFATTLSRCWQAQVLHQSLDGLALKAVGVPHHGHGSNGFVTTEGTIDTLVAGVGLACHFGND